MKNANLKKLALSLAVASSATWGFSVAAEDSGAVNQRYENTRIETSTSSTVSSDRNITEPNVSSSNLNKSSAGADPSRDLEANQKTFSSESHRMESHRSEVVTTDQAAAEADHSGTVRFDTNSVTLDQQAQSELQQIVNQLDKTKPVALVVEVQDEFGLSGSTQSTSARANQDSSSGYPAREPTVAGSTMSPTETIGESGGIPGNSARPSNTAEAIESEREDRAKLITLYRAENIRDYLEDKGIQVVQWKLDGEAATGQNIGVSRLEPGETAASDVQEVRVVVEGDVEPEGLSAL